MKFFIKVRIWRYFLISYLILAGCTEVYFTELQPSGKKPLKEIPPGMQGWFVDNEGTDSINVRTRGFDMTDESAMLSDSIVLTKWNKYYFLNLRDNKKGLWEVYLIEMINPYQIKIAFIDGDNESNIERLQSLTTVTPQEEPDGDIDYYLINPSKKEFKTLVNEGIFDSNVTYRRVN